MKSTFPLLITACIFFTIAGITSCSSTQAVSGSISVASGEIPPEMKTEKFNIIGVLRKRKSYDKYVKKEFALYKGEYVLATMEEANSTYADVSKYRYIMDYTEETSSHYAGEHNNLGQRVSTSSTGFRYFILDRKTGKKYMRRNRSSFFALEMKAYIMAINDAVQ